MTEEEKTMLLKILGTDTKLSLMVTTPFLVLPKAHIVSADEINEGNSDIIAHIFTQIPKIAKLAGLTNGYRIINNCGPDSCQSVPHIHFHVLGGEKLPEHIK